MIYARAAAYLVAWVSLVIVLIRVVVGPLWGSATDIGLVAAPIAFAAGIVGLGWLASIMFKDIAKIRKSTHGDTGQ